METGLWKQFDRIVVFDTETTGIEFGRDEIIELGAAAFSAEGETDCMDLLLRLSPGRTLPPFITQLTGITEEQLEQEGVEKADACEAFCNLLGGGERTLLAAYNAQFDLNFLYHSCGPSGGRMSCGTPVSGCPHGVPGPAGLPSQAQRCHHSLRIGGSGGEQPPGGG